MLTPQNLTLNHPALAPLPGTAPRQETSLFPPFAFLSSEALLAAPIDEGEEDDEDDPEEAEDDLDEEEEGEDEDDYEDEDDDEDDRIIEDDEQDEEEEEEEEDEDDEEEDEPDSNSVKNFFLQRSRSMPRGRLLQ